MEKHPLISVIIPTYNRAHLISETLDSVLQQDYENWECLIVDDGSQDNTAEVVNSYCLLDKRFSFHKRPSSFNKGVNGARNYGLSKSKGVFVQWFDSDDIMTPSLLRLQLSNIFENKKSYSICLYDRFEKTIDNITIPANKNVIKNGMYLDFITKDLRTNLPTILFRRKILEGIKLREDLHKAEEYEFLQRFFKANEQKGVLLNKALVKVRVHDVSLTNNFEIEKIESSLEALLVTYKNLPNNVNLEIKEKLEIAYLKTLFSAYSTKKWGLFFTNLVVILKFKPLRNFILVVYLSLIFVTNYVFNINTWNYHRIYKYY